MASHRRRRFHLTSFVVFVNTRRRDEMSVYSKNSHTEENLKKSIYVTSLRVSQYTQMIMVMMMSMRIQLARAALCEEGKKSSASAMPILCVYCAGRE